MNKPKNTPSSGSPRFLPEPHVDGLLDDVVGGEPNLLPEAKTHDDLKVWFELWAHSDPTLGEESVELFFDGESVDLRSWSGAPIEVSDRFVTLPRRLLRGNDGQHRLRYRVTAYNDESDDSYELVITLDTTAPVLAAESKLIFPSEILPPGKLTAYYLDQHEDQLEADIPGYTTPRPWDRITWFWGRSPGDLNQGGVIELDDKNYSEPLELTIRGQLIRDRGDGLRYVTYRVQDRAGNLSLHSLAVELEVDAIPIPRVLPWPSVENASGNGEQQTLDPLMFTSGAIAVIPDTAVIYPQEEVWVQWGELGSVGEYRAIQEITPGSRRYQIPMQSIAAYIGKTLPVSYRVIDDKEVEWPSVNRTLKIQTVASTHFPTVQCQGLSGGNLSLRSVPDTGAVLTLAPWVLITTDQWIRINMTGVGASGAEVEFPVIRGRQVTQQETNFGVGRGGDVTVSKAFLSSLQRPGPLTGKVYVSFDGGQTWPPLVAPNFPSLYLTLID